jgi:RNA polymerase sigma factor (sigma-70 family)
MSPLNLRRYRAEKLLREQFEALRGKVISAVRARLHGHGAKLDESDLESAYSQAWQGLYAALLNGEEIHNPAGWLTLVTYRRAIDELRGRRGEVQLQAHAGADDRDLEAEIDDRRRLRELMEGMGSRLTERERQAAALCYLQGLSRAEAAQRMGIAPRRMKRLMEGRGRGSPGVASKIGALADAISNGSFCDEQASLMRALAFGVLDPEGERYRIATAHRRSCPACRAYVLSLRGLSAALPPVFLPGLLRHALGSGADGASATTRASVSGGAKTTTESTASGGAATMTGASVAKLAAVGVALLSASAAGVALTDSSSGARSHRNDRPTAVGGEARSAGGGASLPVLRQVETRRAPRARRAPVERARRSTGGQGNVKPLPGRRLRLLAPSPSLAEHEVPALREFGIERHDAGSSAGEGGGSASARAPEAASASQAQREFSGAVHAP